MSCYIHHTQTGDGIIAHRNGKWHDNNHKSQRLLTHTENCAKQAEQNNHRGNDDTVHAQFPHHPVTLQPAGRTQERQDTRIYGFTIIQNLKCTADNQQKSNNPRLHLKPVQQRSKNLPGLRERVRPMKRIFNNNGPFHTVYIGNFPVVFSGRDNPRQNGTQHNN